MSKEITNEQILAGSAVKGDNGKPVGRNTAIEVFDAMVGAAPAIANKATEEGELHTKAVCKMCNGAGVVGDGEIDCYPNGEPYMNGSVKCVKDCPFCASRQVANKAEVDDGMFSKEWKAGYSVAFEAAKKLFATPPATTVASTELRDDLKFSYNAPEVESYVVKNTACLSTGPANFYAYLSVQAESFDKWEKCVAECADGAKEVVELQFKVGDQEWSGSFRELFKILTNPGGASTVLTDERIDAILASVGPTAGAYSDSRELSMDKIRKFAREVAAQAGQVAVPEKKHE